ncbi:MAG: DUF1186 domain-containing protein [Limisphaerales bacterium]
MTPFYTRFPELAARDTRCMHVLNPGGPLPVGEYGFVELYCDDPGCDCRRVLLQVVESQAPRTSLATINFGWESAAFYTRWSHGDIEAGCEITRASLDPLQPQSKYADVLLDFFRGQMMTDPEYVARLARHYEMFKSTQRKPATSAGSVSRATPASVAALPMTVAGILQQLQSVPRQTDFAPYEAALNAASKQREAIVPELIAAIDRVSADPAPCLEDRGACLHHFAICLLTEFRETRALECFLRFFSLPGGAALELTGDLVTEQGAAVLASVCAGDPAPLLRLIHNEAVNPFIRIAAIEALAVQAVWGERSRNAVIEELRRLFMTLSRSGCSSVWAGLIWTIGDFHAVELADEARRAFAEKLVDETIIRLDNLEDHLFRRGRMNLQHFRERYVPIVAADECSGWLCFRDSDEGASAWDEEEHPDGGLLPDELPTPPAELPAVLRTGVPYVAPPKVGRNDPCPCGSGRKYKKCCGKN